MNTIRRSSKNGRSRNNYRNNARRNQGSNGVNLGNAKAAHEKYLEKAKDAISSGDRVLAENFLQYADHYKRIIGDLEERRPASEEAGNEENDNGGYIDSEESVNDTVALDSADEVDNGQDLSVSKQRTKNIPKELAL